MNQVKLTPEMVDSVIISLRSAFQTGSNIPDKVRESGTKFIDDLDKWSEEMRNGNAAKSNS
jgi:hypothetical protein